jgi:hypothetical protein
MVVVPALGVVAGAAPAVPVAETADSEMIELDATASARPIRGFRRLNVGSVARRRQPS